MLRKILPALAVLLLAASLALPNRLAAAPQGNTTWQFAVSGDSRNCGDVVMPGIAAGAQQHQAAFYWHLGDLRAIYHFDEDMQHQPDHLAKPMTIIEYVNSAWQDFIDNQIGPFGSMPFFVGIGNHETVPPRTREDFIAQFADWLGSPVLREQRLRDDPHDHRLRAYYHWVERGVDFIYLDNATPDQFDAAQVRWFERTLAKAASDASVKTVVVGMHRALPDSISSSHSMNESPAGTESGRHVYTNLLKFREQTRKRVYVLASHSHFFMDDIFNTESWRTHGGVLPGWIVGTAGAVRYRLPENAKDARAAETNVYGYLLGTVNPNGEIRFDFQRLNESDIPAAVKSRYTPEFVHWCFAENSQAR